MDYTDFRQSKNIEDNRVPTGEPNPFGETVSGKLGDVWRQATGNQGPVAYAGSVARSAGIPNKLGMGPDNAPAGSLEAQAGNNADYWNDPAKADNVSNESDGTSPHDLVGGNTNVPGSGAINTSDAPSETGSNALDAVQAALDYGRKDISGGAQQGDQSFEEGGPVLPVGPKLVPIEDQHALDMNQLSTSAAKRAQSAVTKRSSGTQSFEEGGAVQDEQIEPQAAPQPVEGDETGAPDQNATGTPPAQAQSIEGDTGTAQPRPALDVEGASGQGRAEQQRPAQDNEPGHLDATQAPITDLIKRYLSGDGAASKQSAEAYANTADPQHQMQPDERNLAAVQAAMEKAGPKAAFGIIQYDRKNWDHEQNLARLALTQGRPDEVVKHLNEAYHYMPDGTHIAFSQSEMGYRAEVEFNKDGKTSYQNVDLTSEQLHDWVNIGKTGQFDAVYEKGGATVLQMLAKEAGTPVQQQGRPQGQQQDQRNREDRLQGQPQDQRPQMQQQPQGQVTNPPGWQQQGPGPRQRPGPLQFDNKGQVTDPQAAQAQGWVQDPDGIWQPPGRHVESAPRGKPTPGGEPEDSPQQWLQKQKWLRTSQQSDLPQGRPQAAPAGDGLQQPSQQDIEARAQRMFPSIGQSHDKEAWIAAQQQAGIKNTIDYKRAGHDYTVEAARIKAAGTNKDTETKAGTYSERTQAKLEGDKYKADAGVRGIIARSQGAHATAEDQIRGKVAAAEIAASAYGHAISKSTKDWMDQQMGGQGSTEDQATPGASAVQGASARPAARPAAPTTKGLNPNTGSPALGPIRQPPAGWVKKAQ